MKHTTARLFMFLATITILGMVTGPVNAADYANGVLSDAVNGFTIKVPTDWTRQAMSNDDSNTHLFVSPDQNVGVGITTYSDGGKGQLGALLSKFQQAVFAGSAQLVEQTTSLNKLNGVLRAYRVQNPDGPVIVGAFAANGQDKSYVAWSMIPEAVYQARFKESDAILNTFTLTASTPSKPSVPPSAGPASTPPSSAQNTTAPKPPTSAPAPSPVVPASPIVVPTPVTVSYRIVKDVPDITFELPTSYQGTIEKGNQLILRSTDTTRRGLTFVAQKMSRTAGGKHATLEASVETALSQLRATPSANLLAQKKMTVGAQPAVWLELTYEAQSGPCRMTQVLTADAAFVYWLGLNGPVAVFNAQIEDLNHAVSTVRFMSAPAQSMQSVQALTRNILAQATSDQYETLVVDDSLVEFDHPKAFAIHEKSEGQSQWSNPNVSGSRVVMVVQSLGRSFGNTAKSVTDGLAAQVATSAWADMRSSEQVTVNGVPVHKLHFTLNQQTGKNHFKYAVLDVPGPHVVTVSFVGPESKLAEIDAHYAQLLRTVKPLNGETAGRLFPADAPGAGSTEPESPEDTFHTIQEMIRAGDWAGFVHLLHSDTVKIEMSRYFGELAEENHLNVTGMSPREAMIKVFKEVPQAAKSKVFLGKPATIKGTRKEDANRVLVMAQFEGGSEQYLWMFREAGHWRWMYK